MSGAPVDPANSEAFRSWDGADGEYWAANADIFDASMNRYLEPLLAAAALQSGERVLDIGCGNGATTIEAARRSTPGRAMGLDLSAAMLAVARARALDQRVLNIEFVQADAQAYHFEPGAFDVVLSRFGVMFFAEPEAAFANIARAVRPGGRAAFAVWQTAEVNPWMRVIGAALAPGGVPPTPPPGAPGPFSLGDPDRLRSLLEGAGFAKVTVTAVSHPMAFGRDLDAAYDFARGLPGARAMLKTLDDAARKDGLSKLRAALEAHRTPDGVLLDSIAWLVGAVRD